MAASVRGRPWVGRPLVRWPALLGVLLLSLVVGEATATDEDKATATVEDLVAALRGSEADSSGNREAARGDKGDERKEGRDEAHGVEEGGHAHQGVEEGGHTEHGSEEEHGEGGHHGEEEEEEVNPVTLTVGFMVFAFLFINMVILHFINYPDPNIRSYVYRMMSTTISVFLAVVSNEAVDSFIVQQIFPSPFPRGFNIKVNYKLHLFIDAMLLLFWYGMLNVIAFSLRMSRGKGYIYALKVIGGHVTAFAGTAFFGLVQQMEFFSRDISLAVLAVVFAALLMGLLRRGSHKLRIWMHLREHRKHSGSGFLPLEQQTGGGPDVPLQPKTVGLAEVPYRVEDDLSFQWSDEVSEAEDEGMALILSFLGRQIALYSIVNRMLPMRGEPDSIFSIWQRVELALWAGGFLVAMSAFTAFLMYQKHMRIFSESQNAKAASLLNCVIDLLLQEHMTGTIQSTFAMCSSLCLCRLGEWIVRCYIHDVVMCQVVTAVCTTTAVLAAIVVLDKIADMTIPDEAESLDEVVHANTNMRNSNNAGDDVNGNYMGAELEGPRQSTGPRHSEHMASQLKEFTLRRIIEGLGLAVGISWEKAFHLSEETLIEGIPVARNHPVVSKLCFAVVLVVVIFPAWLWYLVPKARMHWRDFDREMKNMRAAMQSK